MDVIRHIRRASGIKKVGHAGTLDPLATGVLLVCLGSATKKIQDFMDMRKKYRACVDLSAFSLTDDGEGPFEQIATQAAPKDHLIDTLNSFVGTIMQVPPMFSAISVGGKRAYAQARKGKPIELAARPVVIDTIELKNYSWPQFSIHVTCGKGTYIRSLARDVGKKLGTGGYLCALERTSIGRYSIEESHGLGTFTSPEIISQHLITL